MTKLNLSNIEHVRLINQLQNEMLELIDNRDEFTRSDLQGGATALVMKILRMGEQL